MVNSRSTFPIVIIEEDDDFFFLFDTDFQDEYDEIEAFDLEEFFDDLSHPLDNGYLEDFDEDNAYENGYIGSIDKDVKMSPIVKINGRRIKLPDNMSIHDISELILDDNGIPYSFYRDEDDIIDDYIIWDEPYDDDDF